MTFGAICGGIGAFLIGVACLWHELVITDDYMTKKEREETRSKAHVEDMDFWEEELKE